jgi:hypothetical protein
MPSWYEETDPVVRDDIMLRMYDINKYDDVAVSRGVALFFDQSLNKHSSTKELQKQLFKIVLLSRMLYMVPDDIEVTEMSGGGIVYCNGVFDPSPQGRSVNVIFPLARRSDGSLYIAYSGLDYDQFFAGTLVYEEYVYIRNTYGRSRLVMDSDGRIFKIMK